MKILVTLFLLTSVAAAQPMMMDPMKVSGIPRPDPQVPPGTVTVRVIRGQISNNLVGVDVTLTAPDSRTQTVKTDNAGRATFAGLSAGPFIASAKQGDIELKSQPMQLEPQMGTRVMLAFPNTGAGAPDGVGHPDKALPAGTIIVRAEDASGQALEGLDVVLGHVRAGEQAVVELKAKTDVAGEAKFEGLDRKPTSGYLAEIIANGARFAGKPFKLDDNMGARVVLTIREVSGDTSKLTIAEGSHMLIEVTDDSLQVIEVWRLHNAGDRAFDAGNDGLHLPLPRDAVQAQAPDGNPSLSVVGHDAVYHGPLPPGDSQMRVAFVLPTHGASAVLEQPTPIPFVRVALVTQLLEGLTVSGHDVHGEEREMQGRKLMVYFGGATDRGGALRLEFSNLPHSDPTPRFAAAALCVLLVIVFGIYAVSGGGDRRTRLEVDRQRMFIALEDLDKEIAQASTPELVAERSKLVAKLSDVYRGLDELGGG